ncbi:MAG: EamA family transporter RarD [Dermatophilaceae bacterium]
MTQEDDDVRRGTAYGLLAYGVWGLFPLYFHALKPSGAWEVLAHRILWTMLLCLVVLLVRRDWAWMREVIRRPALGAGLTLAAVLIAANWVIYVFAVLTGHTYEAALGYFLNPILTVALGVVVLRERLRPMQWTAVAVGAVAAVYLAVAGGHFPLVALSLATSFGLYGLLKKRLGVSLQPWHTLFAETAVLTPIAAVILAVVARAGDATYGVGTRHTVLLTLAGIVTAIPLLLFAAAAQRVPLVTIGLIQFMTPVVQLLIGVVVLGEHVSGALWVGFGIVWLALALLTADSLGVGRRAPAIAVADPWAE